MPQTKQARSFFTRPPVIILSVVLIAQACLLYGFARGEAIPLSRPLDGFPQQVGDWHMTAQGVMEPEVQAVLRADDYLNRYYEDGSGRKANFYVAYWRSQRAGQTPHSPKNCLPGSGWIWTVSDTIAIDVPGRTQPIGVNRYIVSKGEYKSVVLYWYQSRDRVVASEYKAAVFSVADALRYNHTDTSLVRIVVGVGPQGEKAANETATDMVKAFFATLRQYFPA
jgi:EpsI family protein